MLDDAEGARKGFAGRYQRRLIRPLDEAGLDGEFTTFSGLDHKGPTGNGLDHVHTLFTGTVQPGISLDQVVAPRLGSETRYESLQLCCGESQTRPSLSFTASGVPMPTTNDPDAVFGLLFGMGGAELVKQRYRLASGRSLLDEMTNEANVLVRRADAADRHKLAEYLEAIRSLEKQLVWREAWLDKPYPKAPETPLLLENEKLMWDLMALALQNDSARVLSLTIPITWKALLLRGERMSAGYGFQGLIQAVVASAVFRSS